MDSTIYNTYLLKIAKINNKIAEKEEEANKEIIAIKARLTKVIDPLKTELEVTETALKMLCIANKDTDFEHKVKFTNGEISVEAKGKSSLIVPDEAFTIAQLKNLKKFDCIKTIEQLNLEVIKAMTDFDAMAPLIGVSLKKPDDKVYIKVYTSTGLV